MKTVPLREAKQSLSGYVEHAQRERVLITKHGRPAALVIGVQGRELEEILAADPDFWALIETRRREPTTSIAEVRARLGFAKVPREVSRRGARRRRAAPGPTFPGNDAGRPRSSRSRPAEAVRPEPRARAAGPKTRAP